MALATAVITYDLEDMVGATFDSRRTRVWVSTNVPGDAVADTAGNKVRIGSGKGTIDDNGTGSVSVWIPGTGSNPASWQTYIHVDYADQRERKSRTFGPFTITASGDLADLIAEQEVPPTYLSAVTAQLDGYVDEAAASAAEAAASAALATDLSGISTSDAVIASRITTPGTATEVALSATIAAGVATEAPAIADARILTASRDFERRGRMRGRRDLARFSDALKTGTAHITVVGNSIAWGVGSDDVSATTTGYVGTYEQYAWPVQLRKRLARERGQNPAQNWMGLAPDWGYATLAGTAVTNQTTGPFGYMGDASGSRGAVSLPSGTANVTIPAAKSGRFDTLDVFYWGTASGVSGGYPPTIEIDGAVVSTGGVTASTGNLVKVTVTGISATAGHDIRLSGTASGPCWVVGVRPRMSTGITVSRIAVPGAKASDVLGNDVWTSQQRTRQADAAVLAGHTDLAIVQFTANDLTAQVALATFSARVQTICDRVTASGGCVLLMGDPPSANEETYTIKGSEYRAALESLAASNAHVAFADFAEMFGDRSRAYAAGLFPDSGTVHPSAEGHKRMADFMYDLLPGASV